jgi:hypothetical protein
MATTQTKLSELSGEDLTRLLALMGSADSIELKLTVPEQQQRSTVTALGLDPLEAQIRQVVFFDTPKLTLNKAGVVVRARRVQGRPGDTVVKLRPVVPDELPDNLRKSKSVGVEVDAMPGGYVCSASMKGRVSNEEVRDVVTGRRSARKLFAKEQRAFLAEHAPEGTALDELSILGPIFVLKLNFTPADFDRKLVAEMWLYPDGERILELSTKCMPDEAFQVAVETRAFLEGRGVELGGEQQTKTKTALEFFAKELAS